MKKQETKPIATSNYIYRTIMTTFPTYRLPLKNLINNNEGETKEGQRSEESTEIKC